jgi:hypothetical protein
MATAKKAENALEDVALIAGTQQNLSNPLFFRYICHRHIIIRKL